jgi:hypothetical protein
MTTRSFAAFHDPTKTPMLVNRAKEAEGPFFNAAIGSLV